MDGDTYKMEFPFFVIATQNPIEQEGTYKLPEAQLDRFLFKINLQYPTLDNEKEILRRFRNDFSMVKKEDVKPEFLKKILNSKGKIDTRIFPKKRTHIIKPHTLKNLVPENFKLSGVTRKFIQKISKDWTQNAKQLDNYELLKSEITKIYKSIGKLKYNDDKTNNAAVKLGDSIVQMVQDQKLREEQSTVLRKGINQCLEKLHTLPKEK